jgi:hypothetical protein
MEIENHHMWMRNLGIRRLLKRTHDDIVPPKWLHVVAPVESKFGKSKEKDQTEILKQEIKNVSNSMNTSIQDLKEEMSQLNKRLTEIANIVKDNSGKRNTL